MKKIWGIEYDEIYSGNLMWSFQIRNPFMENGKYKIGLNEKFLREARKKGVDKFLIKIGEKEMTMSVPSEKFVKEKDKRKEHEDKPSLFAGKPPMRIYHFII